MRLRRRTLVLAAIVGVMIVVLWIAGPPASGDRTAAFRRFLTAYGIRVRSSASPPPPGGTYVLLADARAPAEEGPILSWVQRGGRLVVADPTSAMVTLLGVLVGPPVGLVGPRTMSPGCASPVAVGVGTLVVDAADVTLRSSSPDGVSCFVRGGGSYAVLVHHGAGSVALLGGWSFLANDYLDQRDNAVFVLRLVGGGPVVMGSAFAPGTAPPGIWDLLPLAARVLVVAAVLAALVFAAARARRLGAPVREEIPAPIPASALVAATAGLYRRARTVGFCGGMLRASAASRLARGVGAPAGMPPDRLAAEVADATGLAPERVREALSGMDPATDEELIALAAELSAIVRGMEGAPR